MINFLDAVLVAELKCNVHFFSLFSVELDGAWVFVVVIKMPGSELFCEFLVGSFLEVDFVGGNDWFILSIGTKWFERAHAEERDACKVPFLGASCDSSCTDAVACESFGDEECCEEAVGLAELAVEEGGEGAPSLVAEEVADGCKGGFVFFFVFPSFEFFADEVSKEFFSFDLGELNSSMDFSFKDELFLGEVGEVKEECCRPGTENLLDVGWVGKELVDCFSLFFWVFREGRVVFVEFVDELFELADVGEETFWDENSTELFAFVGSKDDDLADFVDDILERLASFGDFF